MICSWIKFHLRDKDIYGDINDLGMTCRRLGWKESLVAHTENFCGPEKNSLGSPFTQSFIIHKFLINGNVKLFFNIWILWHLWNQKKAIWAGSEIKLKEMPFIQADVGRTLSYITLISSHLLLSNSFPFSHSSYIRSS